MASPALMEQEGLLGGRNSESGFNLKMNELDKACPQDRTEGEHPEAVSGCARSQLGAWSCRCLKFLCKLLSKYGCF